MRHVEYLLDVYSVRGGVDAVEYKQKGMSLETQMLFDEANEKFRKIWELLNEIGNLFQQIKAQNGELAHELTPEERLNQGRMSCPSCG